MSYQEVSPGIVHPLPADIKRAILSDETVFNRWQSLTPLARNEWICWTITVKQQKTRDDHVRRLVKELSEGKRRPCCWIGCIHRTDKELSPSVKGILSKRSKSGV